MAESSKSGVFAFDQFRLDGDKLMLYRDGIEVSIPPKVAKTLAVLVESAGTIISKEEVIDRVWDDSIVEESNLTQYLYLLRKVLGHMPDGRPYIETLRRRGYRFNGAVERVPEERVETAPPAKPMPLSEPAATFGGVGREGNVLRLVEWRASELPPEEEPPPQVEVPRVETVGAVPASRRVRVPRLAIVAVLLLAAAGLAAAFLWPRLMPAATNAETQKEITVMKLTNGHVPAAATISPDGNVFVYHELDTETSRMYVQQTGQASRIQIASSSDKVFGAKTFSPDGQSVYYLGIDKKTTVPTLYRIPTMGGSPVKLVDHVYGGVSFSPDGKEMAFSRYNHAAGESSIVVAGKDGNAERVILQRKVPARVGSAVGWSPDGKSIAVSEQSVPSGRSYDINRLTIVDVATGRVTPLSEEIWDNILRLMWVPDGGGIVMLGTRQNEGYSTRRDQLYFVSYPGGVSNRLTTDGNRHETESLGVTKKGEVLVVPGNRSSQVWVMNPDGDSATATQLTRGAADGRAGLAPLPDGRFGYLARNADEISLMLGSADGSETKQLATGFQFVDELRADPFGRFFVFSTLNDRKSYLYRIDIESGALKQLTFGERSIDSTVSPDGKHLVFDEGRHQNNVQRYSLLRIRVEGGEPATIKASGCYLPTYSPDGSLISCVDTEKGGIVVVSAADGAELERHSMPVSAIWNFGVGWTLDGSGLIYIVTEKGTSNLWIQPRDGGKPRRFTNFTSGTIYRYAFSPDGSKLFVARGYPTHDAVLIRNFR